MSMRYRSSLLFFLTLRPRLVILAEHRQFDIDLREYSKNVSLKNRDEDLKSKEDDRRGYGDHGHDRPKIQDEAEEDEDDRVPRQYVGVESQCERERLGELLDELDEPHKRDHERLEWQPRGHKTLEIRPHPVAPEALVLGEDERQQRERQREGDVAGDRVTVREETDDVEREQEDEDGEGIREPLSPLLAHLPAQVVATESVDLLDYHLIRPWPVAQCPAPEVEDDERDRRPDAQEPDGLVQGDVYRPDVY